MLKQKYHQRWYFCFNTVDTVYTVDMIYTVDMVFKVHTVDTVYTIQTALRCLNEYSRWSTRWAFIACTTYTIYTAYIASTTYIACTWILEVRERLPNNAWKTIMTFANKHVRSVLFITCRQGSRLRVALAQIFRMRASTSLFPLTQRYFYRALVLTPIHFFLIKINFEATCESKSSP